MITYMTLDPRPASLDAELAKIHQAQADGMKVIGIEVTVPALAAACDENIDHHGGDESRAAIAQVAAMPVATTHVCLVTVRPDADSVGAMALYSLLYCDIAGIRPEMRDRIEFIARNDTFEHGEWPGPQPLNVDDMPLQFAGLGALAADRSMSLEDRVSAFARWLSDGEVEGLHERQARVRADCEKALETSSFSVDASGRIAVVESGAMAATVLAYRLAPVAALKNPAFRFNGGEPHVKYTVCAFQSRYADFPAILADLKALEPGWGGNSASGILGSPQGVSSALSMEQVVEVVSRHLK